MSDRQMVVADLNSLLGAGMTAGTTSLAPLKFTAGTNLTTPAAGAMEYDGSAFYTTPIASNRGVNLTEHFLSLAATQTATSANTAQTWFPGGGATGITLAATTSYFFEGQLYLANGTTTHTTALLFALSNGLTLTSIAYWADIAAAVANTPTAASSTFVNVATSTVINSTSTAAGAYIAVQGIVRTNVAGTFSPQFQWSANPTGTNQVLLNTWFRMRPIGTNTVLSVGNWA